VIQFGLRLRTLDKATATAPLHSVQAFLRKKQNKPQVTKVCNEKITEKLIPLMVGRAKKTRPLNPTKTDLKNIVESVR
jgi:hypothetical protein